MQVVDALDAPLAAAAHAAAQQPAAPPGAFCSQSWAAGSGGGSELQPAAKRARVDDGAKAALAQPAHPRHPKGVLLYPSHWASACYLLPCGSRRPGDQA